MMDMTIFLFFCFYIINYLFIRAAREKIKTERDARDEAIYRWAYQSGFADGVRRYRSERETK